jgi:hypothetical protein
LILPKGEISAVLLFQVLEAADKDGRPLLVHQLGDADPSGNQMVVSTARKLQALRDTHFPGQDMRVYAPALAPDQCREWNLQTKPLSETEKRADKWEAMHGWGQTELDAAQVDAEPELIAAVEASIKRFHATGASRRNAELKRDLVVERNEALREALGPERLAAYLADMEEKQAAAEAAIEALNDAACQITQEMRTVAPELPEIVWAKPDGGDGPDAIYDSRDSFAVASERMKARKAFEL